MTPWHYHAVCIWISCLDKENTMFKCTQNAIALVRPHLDATPGVNAKAPWIRCHYPDTDDVLIPGVNGA